MNIFAEFTKLKKRFRFPKLKIRFDKSLDELGFDAYFSWYHHEIVLPDRRVTRERMISLLHEFCHAIQFRENRLVMDRRCIRRMYLEEFEAELFAVEQFERIYGRKMGSCLQDDWSLGTYREYQSAFKKSPAIYNT